MKIVTKICLLSALLLPIYASAAEWTKEQQDVLEFEKGCLTTTQDVDKLLSCFHEDYVGWSEDAPFPLSKADQRVFITENVNVYDREMLVFKPLSVIVKSNMAVISYVEMGKTTKKGTDEVSYYSGRWTDVCLKEGGKWYWISDHGVNILDD